MVPLKSLLQGMFSAALVPLSQAILFDIYPMEQRGFAMAVWGMGVMIGPILGRLNGRPKTGSPVVSLHNTFPAVVGARGARPAGPAVRPASTTTR